MKYNDAISYLFASQPAFHQVGAAAYKPGFDNINALMSHLGNPHRQLRCVHIAGTNGKGSTSHLIAAALQASGLRVGLFTSPHLVDSRERIRINGQMIGEEYVTRFVEDNRAFFDSIKPSFFETTTAMAFRYFADEKVDIAVIEVGLGGRLDSTNIITPVLSVITNIGFDHTEFLGSTLPQIASEKAGIIKDGVPVVIGETDDETEPVFMAKAVECGSTIYFADQCEYLRRCRKRFAGESQLHGIYQEKNLQTAFVALRALGITNAAIAEGFANVCTMTGLRGRWETLATMPLTICDTGHNSHGIKYVVEQLRSLLQSPKDEDHIPTLHIVFGMVSDKDVEVVREMLHKLKADFPGRVIMYPCQAKTKRAIAAPMSVEEAVRAAQKAATDRDIIFIGGSNYVVGEALPLFN